jgi:Family of unknown function (DUF6941)
MIERHIQTIFCDDIRHEIGNKMSYIGVYSGTLIVQSFPVTLPKLCLSVKIVTPPNQPLRSLILRVLKDEEIMQEITVDEKDLVSASEPYENMKAEDHKHRLQLANFFLVFSPLVLDGPCILRVRAQTEEGELRGMALAVQQAKSPNDPE